MTRKGIGRLCLKLAMLAVSIGLASWSSDSQAAEKRCDELGKNCVCARSLSATKWVQSSAADFYYEANQDTSDDKICGSADDGRATIWTPGPAPTVVTGLNGVAALQHDGKVLTLGPAPSQKSGLTGRIGMRYYLKLGPGYQTTGDGGCTNDKYMQWGDYLTAYNTGFTNSADGKRMSVTPASIIGKWVRLEMYLDSHTNPSTYTVFIKNITDRTAEQVMTFPARLGQLAIPPVDTRVIHRYRAGTCAGGSAMMYAIVAHWASPAGQRIGPALELEGESGSDTASPSGTVNSPPVAPTGLTVK